MISRKAATVLRVQRAVPGDVYCVIREQYTAGAHDTSCSSYDPPDELSGLGVLMGSANQVDSESGMAALKLDFRLSKVGALAASAAGIPDSNSVVGDTKRLSLGGLLHYLWHEAELTVWTSRWAGKRHWWDMRWHLVEAAGQMRVKGGARHTVRARAVPVRRQDCDREKARPGACFRAAPEERPQKADDPGRRGQGVQPGSQRPQVDHQAHAGVRVPVGRESSSSASNPF
uniref:Uncharacterized protein n=1 Tax=Rhizobium loti TaxID=381 RepID=M5AM31_RHILI|nr:conserved hypothetical protein [Mesorhizobium loti NZP2037]